MLSVVWPQLSTMTHEASWRWKQFIFIFWCPWRYMQLINEGKPLKSSTLMTEDISITTKLSTHSHSVWKHTEVVRCCVSEAWLSQSRYNPISSGHTLSIHAWQIAYGKKMDLLTHIFHFCSCCPLVKLTWPDEQLRLKQATFVILFKGLSDNNPAPNPHESNLLFHKLTELKLVKR